MSGKHNLKQRQEKRRRKGAIRHLFQIILLSFAVFIGVSALEIAGIGSGIGDFRFIGTTWSFTRVTGTKTEINASAKGELKDKIVIMPANGRKVILQQYDEESDSWRDREEFVSEDQNDGAVTLVYPKAWTEATYTTWRVYVPGISGAAPYIGDPIHVTCANRKDMKLHVRAAVVYCVDNGKVLYDVNMHDRLPNASTTKIMSFLVERENADPGKIVTVSDNAVHTDWAALGMKKGMRFTMNDMLNAMLIESSNDAAVVIAENTSGSVSAFAAKMNEKAKALGLRDTRFLNPHGLDQSGHYSSAYDLALMDAEAMKDDLYREIILRKTYSFKNINGKKKFRVKTSNRLLEADMPRHLGGKTGTTTNGGNCFVGAYQWKGKLYITTVLASRDRWEDTKKLCRYIRNYAE